MNKFDYEDLSVRWTDSLKEKVLEEIKNLIDSGYYIGGSYLDRFESEFSSYVDKNYTVGVGSGLAALEIGLSGLLSLGVIETGAKVFMPSNCYIASILAVKSNGLRPILVDSSSNILPTAAEYGRAIGNQKGFVILDVPMYGIPRPSSEIATLCANSDGIYLEDLSQAHGGLDSGGLKVGRFSSVQFWSFYPTKNIGGIGESGAITTDSVEYKSVFEALRNYGSREKYKFEYIGTNGRMDNIQAILVYNYMRFSMQNILSRKKEIATYYTGNIKNDLLDLPEENHYYGHAFHIYPVRCKENREAFIRYLDSHGISTVIHYPIPNHSQKALKNIVKFCDNADKWSNQELSLPLNPRLNSEDIKYIVQRINEFSDRNC